MPFARVTADHVELPPCSHGSEVYKYCLGIVDTFSKVCFYLPLKNLKAPATIKAFSGFFNNVTRPQLILTDMGSTFVSAKFLDFLSRNNVEHKAQMPYSPSSHYTEYSNKLFVAITSMYLTAFKTTNWYELLPQINLALRSLPREYRLQNKEGKIKAVRLAPHSFLYGTPAPQSFESTLKILLKESPDKKEILDLRAELFTARKKADITEKMAFDKADKRPCWANHTYHVKCGDIVKEKMKEDENLLVYNLLPGKVYNCSYVFSGSPNLQKSVTLRSQNTTDFHSDSPFSIHDNGIFLMGDLVSDLLLNPNLTVALKVFGHSNNENYTGLGLDAVSDGVTGLRPASKYQACLTMGQVAGTCTYACSKQTWCRIVKTLPELSPHEESLIGLWILVSLLAICTLTLMTALGLLWLRVNAMGATSSRLAWIQLRRRGLKPSETEENDYVVRRGEILSVY